MPERCPNCEGKQSLVRSGFYTRQVINELDERFSIDIQRVRCRDCNSSHSQLYDFLVPYRRISFAALKHVAEDYILNATTYLDAVGSGVEESASVFSAVERLLENLGEIWMLLMQTLITVGFRATMLGRQKDCPNGIKAKKRDKKRLLDWAATMLELVPNALEICNRYGLAIFGSGRGCTLKRTHSTECKLF